jgi:hypothetical protein
LLVFLVELLDAGLYLRRYLSGLLLRLSDLLLLMQFLSLLNDILLYVLDGIVPLLKLGVELLEMSLFLLKTLQIDAVVDEVVEVAVELAEVRRAFVALILRKGLDRTVNWAAWIVQ